MWKGFIASITYYNTVLKTVEILPQKFGNADFGERLCNLRHNLAVLFILPIIDF